MKQYRVIEGWGVEEMNKQLAAIAGDGWEMDGQIRRDVWQFQNHPEFCYFATMVREVSE